MADQVLGNLVWKVTGDTTNFDKNIKNTDKKVDSFGSTVGKVGGIIAGAFSALAILDFGKKIVGLASDLEETNNKFNVVFSGVEGAAEEAEKLADGFGLSGLAAKQLLSDTGDLLASFGVVGDESLELSSNVAQLGADLASFSNFSGGAKGATEALTAALFGEAERAKGLGLALNQTELKRFAEEQGLVFDELDRGERSQLTYELAVRQAQNAVGDFARSQGSFANQLRIAQASIEDQQTILGEGLLPIANVGVTLFNEFAENSKETAENIRDFTRSVEGAAAIAGTLGTIAGTLATIGEAGVIIFDGIKEGVDAILEPLARLSAGAQDGAAAFGFLGGITQLVSSAFKILGTFTGIATNSIISLGEAVFATGDVLGGFFDLLQGNITQEQFDERLAKAGEAFKAFEGDVVGGITTAFDVVAEEVTNFGQGAADNAERLTEAFSEAQDNITARVFTALRDAGEATSDAVGETNDDIVSDTADTVSELDQLWADWEAKQTDRFATLAEDGVGNLLKGFEAVGEALVLNEDAAASFGRVAIEALASVLSGIGSQLAALAAQATVQAIINRDPSLIPAIAQAGAGSSAAFLAAGALRAQAQTFADGGIVAGSSYKGDRVPALVNSGEMILNREQQANLFNMANGAGSGTTINLVIDGKVVASTVVDQINNGVATVRLNRGVVQR